MIGWAIPMPRFLTLFSRLGAGTSAARELELQRAANRQQAARILDEYGNSILRFAYSYVRNLPDAEDILQEVLIRYLNQAPGFEDAAHEKAWLLRVTANLSCNSLRYLRSHQTDALREELTAEGKEDLSFLWDAVRMLPRHYRQAIHLFYYEGYDTAEIADLLGRKESTVRSDLHRGRIRLREILKEAYDFG